MKCKIKDCCNEANSLGMCRKHYTRYLRTGNPELRRNFAFMSLDEKLSRFKVSENGCWEWTAGLNNKGYGTVYCDGKKRYAHRVSYFNANGLDLNTEGEIMHSCDNPKCINPDHLRLGTRKENVEDCVNKERNSRGYNHGKKLTNDSVLNFYCLYKLGHRERDIIAISGLKQSTLNGIFRKRNWKWLTDKFDILTERDGMSFKDAVISLQ